MKLRVVELLLVTTVPALFLASGGLPNLTITLATLFGGTLAAGAANAFNMVIESDIDQVMGRTSSRPLVRQAMSEAAALTFAFAITVISLLTFWVFTNPLATGLTVAAIAFYVFGYTVGLKRRTSQNIVWGGIAGCMPVLIGWAAVTGDLSITAWLFFLLIFFWTPPHFWALAIKYKDDYERAGVPMLPVVAPMKSVVLQMWLHTSAMILTSYAVIVSVGGERWIYLVTTGINTLFLAALVRMRGDAAQIESAAIKVFKASITYLTLFSILLVFVALL